MKTLHEAETYLWFMTHHYVDVILYSKHYFHKRIFSVVLVTLLSLHFMNVLCCKCWITELIFGDQVIFLAGDSYQSVVCKSCLGAKPSRRWQSLSKSVRENISKSTVCICICWSFNLGTREKESDSKTYNVWWVIKYWRFYFGLIYFVLFWPHEISPMFSETGECHE